MADTFKSDDILSIISYRKVPSKIRNDLTLASILSGPAKIIGTRQVAESINKLNDEKEGLEDDLATANRKMKELEDESRIPELNGKIKELEKKLRDITGYFKASDNIMELFGSANGVLDEKSVSPFRKNWPGTFQSKVDYILSET